MKRQLKGRSKRHLHAVRPSVSVRASKRPHTPRSAAKAVLTHQERETWALLSLPLLVVTAALIALRAIGAHYDLQGLKATIATAPAGTQTSDAPLLTDQMRWPQIVTTQATVIAISQQDLTPVAARTFQPDPVSTAVQIERALSPDLAVISTRSTTAHNVSLSAKDPFCAQTRCFCEDCDVATGVQDVSAVSTSSQAPIISSRTLQEQVVWRSSVCSRDEAEYRQLAFYTDDPGQPFGLRLARAARGQTREFVVYNDDYRPLTYPGGDVPPMYGVCTDVIVRAYRALGVDLQVLVHRAKVGSGDASIDHRRTEILRKFLDYTGEILPITDISDDYQPGDIVTYDRPQNPHVRAHIALVSDVRGASGRPMIVHNRGWGPQLEDALFVDRITGHYRFNPTAPHFQVSQPNRLASDKADQMNLRRSFDRGAIKARVTD